MAQQSLQHECIDLTEDSSPPTLPAAIAIAARTQLWDDDVVAVETNPYAALTGVYAAAMREMHRQGFFNHGEHVKASTQAEQPRIELFDNIIAPKLEQWYRATC